MTLLVNYRTKKALKEAVGKPLRYTETSVFGPEYKDDGVLVVTHRPQLQGGGSQYIAKVTMKGGLVEKVV